MSKKCNRCGRVLSDREICPCMSEMDSTREINAVSCGDETRVFDVQPHQSSHHPVVEKKKNKKLAVVIVAIVISAVCIAAALIWGLSMPKNSTGGTFFFEEGKLIYADQSGEKTTLSFQYENIKDLTPVTYFDSRDKSLPTVYISRSGGTAVYQNKTEDKKASELYCFSTKTKKESKISGESFYGAEHFGVSDDGSCIFYMDTQGSIHRYLVSGNTDQAIVNDAYSMTNMGYSDFLFYTDKDGILCEMRAEEKSADIFPLGKGAVPVYSNTHNASIGAETKFDKDMYYVYGGSDLYKKAKGKDIEKVAENCDYLISTYSDGSMYYLDKTERKIKYTDVIDDDVQGKDQEKPSHPVIDNYKLTTPDKSGETNFKDFSTAYYESENYKNYSEDFVWFYENGKPTAKATGLDADLLQIVNWKKYSDDLTGYYKRISDGEKTSSAIGEKYMEELREKEFRVTFQSLIFQSGGKEKTISENIVGIAAVSDDKPLMAVVTVGENNGKLKLSELLNKCDSLEKVKAEIEGTFSQEIKAKETLNIVSLSEMRAAVTSESVGQALFSKDGSEMFFATNPNKNGDGFEIKKTVIENGKPVSTATAAENVTTWNLSDDGTLVYATGDSGDVGKIYMDTELISTNVYIPSIKFRADGNVTYLTDYDKQKHGGTLVQVSDKKGNTISGNVSMFHVNDLGVVSYMSDYNSQWKYGTIKIYDRVSGTKELSKTGTYILSII